MINLENFIAGLKNLNRGIRIEETDTTIILLRRSYVSSSSIDHIGKLNKQEIIEIIEEIDSDTKFIENMLHTKTMFEISIRPQEHSPMTYRLYDGDFCRIEEHNYIFEISKPSTKYVIAMICSAANLTEPIMKYPIGRRPGMSPNPITSVSDLSDVLRILTAKIVSPTECNLGRFKNLLSSYLFNIAFNNDIAFDIENLTSKRIPHKIVAERDGQLFPYKSYKQELIRYYYQALSTDISFAKYMAFYHVAEFYFHTIVEEDAFKEISDFITKPSFSPYNKNDLRCFYDKIKKKIREQREDGVWDEKIGLLLCLKKYVPDILGLKSRISSIEENALDYYQTNDVSFAEDAKRINFDNDDEKIYKAIRDRVYSVRNAIVHSKEGEKLRYEPFLHDQELAREIPLIRSIAEEIIINSAKSIEF